VLLALASPLFFVGAATIETGLSLVKKIIASSRNFPECYTWAMKIISTTEAARRLKVSPSRVRAMIKAKRLKAMKVGHEWLIDPKDLEAVKERKVGRPRKSRKSTKSKS
jgi:excisionase family DNA binding protein